MGLAGCVMFFTRIRKLIILAKVIAQQKSNTTLLERFVILPCPFCGSKRTRIRYDDIDGWVAYVCCDGDFRDSACEDMIGPMSRFKYVDKEEAAKDAINQWNRREG